jgi:hypothetical protein
MTDYCTTITEAGRWLHASDSNFLFTFIKDSWNDSQKKTVTSTFEKCLPLFSVIKNTVSKKIGDDVVDGLYLLDQASMTDVMNSIKGMGQTSVQKKGYQGKESAKTICQSFFTHIFENVGGDVTPMSDYLIQELEKVQAQAKKTTITKDFGILIGVVTLVPMLDIPVVTFEYVYTSSTTQTWFVTVKCTCEKKEAYSFSCTYIKYNYDLDSITAA